MKRPANRIGGRRSLRARSIPVVGAFVLSALVLGSAWAQTAAPATLDSLEDLGRALFADPNLSRTRSQSCISCHSPELAFTDPRELGAIGGAVSLGADGQSLGDRNAPSVAYTSLAPEFRIAPNGKPLGGFFWDGRARTLEDQAGGPPLNPVEMGMPGKESVVTRLKENSAYVEAFKRFFGAPIFDDTVEAYTAMTKAIAAFERTSQLNSFDSKYDLFLRGEAELNAEESLGRDLFFSNTRSSCTSCHISGKDSRKEVFSNFGYYNLGVPANRTVRSLNRVKADYVDAGLSETPGLSTPSHKGRFKVPSLRNVAVTGPYMHNGIFKSLRTAVLFHQRFSPERRLNPETGQPWEEPEIPGQSAPEALQKAPPLNDQEIDAIVSFLKTLTDKSYGHLLEP